MTFQRYGDPSLLASSTLARHTKKPIESGDQGLPNGSEQTREHTRLSEGRKSDEAVHR